MNRSGTARKSIHGVTHALFMALAAGLLAPLLSAQAGRSDYIGVIHEGVDLLVELRAGASGPADRVELRLNKAASRGATLEHGPKGWTARGEGPAVILEGPSLEVFPALFRIRIGQEKTPPVANVRTFVLGEQVRTRDVRIVRAPPAVVSEGLEGLLVVPPVAFGGETVAATVLIPRATPSIGTWRFEDREAISAGEVVQIEIPPNAAEEIRLSARFDDPWSRTTITGEVSVRVEPLPQRAMRPRLDGAQPVALAGEAVTVCGWFPPQARAGVLLDGKPVLKVAGGSLRSLILTLPAQTPPGRHFLSGDPDIGFADGISTLQVVRLDTSVDRAMQPPHVRIRVLGMEDPVKVRVVNLDPLAASLVGGESQIVETDGGRENVALIAMQPSEYPSSSPHDLNIMFTLAEPRDACAVPGVSPTSTPGARVAN